jgi:hypothetical protein
MFFRAKEPVNEWKLSVDGFHYVLRQFVRIFSAKYATSPVSSSKLQSFGLDNVRRHHFYSCWKFANKE